MKRYYVAYMDNGFEVISEVVLRAHNLREAKAMAHFYKRSRPEIMRHRNVRTYVRPAAAGS